ncbi:MAG TPA: nuclear transport factor 2 family protein [Roseiarcus sp.]|nr:nuclear transport factor 2 family protein [Roseiarcus sp.]
MTDVATIAEKYIALWNEADQNRRKALIAKAWTEDAIYADPMMQGRGHDEIDALIGAVHQRFPGHRFALSGRPDGHGDKVRFSWTLGVADAAPIAHGTDFGIVANDGRLKAITGFLDHVSA